MASTPFFFLSGLLFLAWFTADVHSVKVIDVLNGSSVVLRPDESVTSITTITWKHGDNLAVDWLEGHKAFYNIFSDTCSLNTKTGELTINNVRPEHSGVYTPDINGKTRSAMELRVFLKVIDVLEGSTVVLHPVESVTSITVITWKHGDNLAVDWFGGDPTFFNIFSDNCSLNTETGELTIYNVRPEHSGVYMPDINGRTRSAMKLRVLSPVPKPSITHDCYPGKTKCTLRCMFDKTDDLGHMEVFWIRDDRRVNGSELPITKDTKEETFICSLNNPFSSKNSTELQNPLLPEEVIGGLKGSSVILRPDESVTSITSITWKHNDDLAVEWNGEDPFFYHIFSDYCSLNTETGELTIHNVRPEHSGVYTPDINGKTRSAMELRVLSPVPKPSITHDCYPGKTKCTLRCSYTYTADRTGDLGDVEVFWIRDDRRVNGSELQITDKDTKEETFICSLDNSVSSENSTELLNPLLLGETGVPVWIRVVLTLVSLALLAFVCWKWIYPRCRCYWIIREIRKTMPLTEHNGISAETPAAGSVPDRDQALINVDGVILRILRKGNKRNLSEVSILMLLTARYVILRILRQRYEVRNSLEKVGEIMERFFKGTNDLGLSNDENKELLKVYLMIFKILNSNELQLSADDYQALHHADEVIFRTRVGN